MLTVREFAAVAAAWFLFSSVAVSAASVLPMTFEDKRAAIAAACINRFAIGFLISASTLAMPWPVTGLFIGVLLSVPEALITKAYVPIMIVGAVGGVVIGFIASAVLG